MELWAEKGIIEACWKHGSNSTSQACALEEWAGRQELEP